MHPALSGIGNGEGVLLYEEENTLLPGDGGSATQSFPPLAGIGNGEINSLPYKPKKMIPPNKNKKKFGSTKIWKNKKSPVSQLNTINASNATPLRPQSPTSDEYDPDAGFSISTSPDLVQTSRSVANKVYTHQHAGQYFVLLFCNAAASNSPLPILLFLIL